jgi:hypothetical protein
MSPSQSYQTSLSRDLTYQDRGAPHDPSEGYHGGPEVSYMEVHAFY